MIGKPGQCNAHLAIALRLKARTRDYNVPFKNAVTLFTELCEAKDNYHLGKLERTLAKADLLIIDELNYLSFNQHHCDYKSTILKVDTLFENTTMVVAALIDWLTFRKTISFFVYDLHNTF